MPAPGTEATAAEWLIRLEEDPSQMARAEFEAWIAKDARHRAAFLRLEKTWRRADILKRLKPVDGQVDENVLDKFGKATPIPDPPAPSAPAKDPPA